VLKKKGYGMCIAWDPSAVSDDILALSRSLGDPALDLVILAEGNVSKRIDQTKIIVKASGVSMRTAEREDFVVVNIEPLVALLADSNATQAELTELLKADVHDGEPRQGSIETLIHVAVQATAPMTFVAHTHPTPVVALLSSVHAEDAFADAAYTDEVLVLGKPLFVPYAAPGIALGRIFLARLQAYFAANGRLPSLILLQNHGIVCLAHTAEAVAAISLMAVKSARVRLGALSIGGLAGLGPDVTADYWERQDFVERRAALSVPQ
jgi:rhamnose utilization protein RhaD (predicted bifunctional aldolase and dehydrogenase)